MFYHLLVPLARDHILFNVFRYLTFRSLMALITALLISLVLGPWLVRRLRAVQNGGDTIREVSFADSALQYCPTCQTGGKPLADRRLSRLLK